MRSTLFWNFTQCTDVSEQCNSPAFRGQTVQGEGRGRINAHSSWTAEHHSGNNIMHCVKSRKSADRVRIGAEARKSIINYSKW